MPDMNGGRGTYKARKTPTKIYPSLPPKLPTTVEVLYHAVDDHIATKIEAELGDRIVTSQILYKPAILCAARINFHGNRWFVHYEKDIVKVVPFPAKHQICNWDASLVADWKHHNGSSDPVADSRYDYDGSFDFSRERFHELQEELQQHLLSSVVLPIEYNPHLKLERKLDETEESFLSRCMEAARADYEKESHNVEGTLHRLQDRLKQRLEREIRQIDNEELEEGEKRDSTVLIDELKNEMEKLQKLRQTKLNELEETLSMIAKEREKDVLRLNRGNLAILRFALIWLPYTEYVVQEENSRRLQLVQSF